MSRSTESLRPSASTVLKPHDQNAGGMRHAPVEKRLKFFIYVIESPSAPDLYHRRSESDMIEQAVGLNGIPSVARMAISREAFEPAMAALNDRELVRLRATQALGRLGDGRGIRSEERRVGKECRSRWSPYH